MYKIFVVPVIVLLLLFGVPERARAEDGCRGLACWFSWDFKTVERTQIKEDAATERERLEQEGETDRARLQNEWAAEETRLQNEHDAALERINREADTAIAQAQRDGTIAQARKDEYVAMVENWRMVQTEALNADLNKSLEAIRGQTRIGLEAIETAGEVKRWALTTDMVWSVVLISGLIFLGWFFLRKQGQGQTIYVLPGPGSRPRQLPPGYRAHLPQGHDQQEIVIYEDYQ
jgi:hypothetical protein